MNGKESIVSNLVQPNRINFNKSWNDIEKMLDKIQSSSFRNKIKDLNGNGWIYNWFCLDHVNMSGDNPRNRDLGHHKVLDFYTEEPKKEIKMILLVGIIILSHILKIIIIVVLLI